MAKKRKNVLFGLFFPSHSGERKHREKETMPREAAVCWKCGKKNDYSAAFCKHCGVKLADASVESPAQPEFVIGGWDYDPYPVAGEQGGTIPTHIGEEIAVQPEPYRNDDSLRQEIDRVGKTIGRQNINTNPEQHSLVTGWIVGVSGQAYGKCFTLKIGKNRVGLSPEMDAELLSGEENPQRIIAQIVYDSKLNEFYIFPGESDILCYVNEAALYEQMKLIGFETVEFGDGGLNVFKFVPFCGERFCWNDIQ